jgi:hypothetical protein
MVSTGTYSEILKERKKGEISTVNAACFLPRKGKIFNQGLHQRSTISEECHGQKKINAAVLQWHLQKVFVWASNITK